METKKIASHLTAKIVRSYVRHHTVGAAQLSDLITTVHRALGELGQPNHPEEVRTPAVSVRRSVHQDYVICLDCGYRGKTLRRHISTRHDLSRDEYLKRWGVAGRSSTHRSSLFEAAFESGEGTWARSETQSTCRSGSVTNSGTGAGTRGSGTRGDAHTETKIPFCNKHCGCRE